MFQLPARCASSAQASLDRTNGFMVDSEKSQRLWAVAWEIFFDSNLFNECVDMYYLDMF